MSFPPPLIPKSLPPNAKIAPISPSFRVNTLIPTALARAQTLLSSLGYTITTIFQPDGEDLDPVLSAGEPIPAGIRNRLAELRAAFADPTVDMVLCTVGGSTATELIPYLVADVDLQNLIRENPKIFVGYSDITVLHWCLRALTGLRTFYGPCAVSELGEAVTSTGASVSSFDFSQEHTENNKTEDDGYLQDFHLAHLLQVLSTPITTTTPIPIPRSTYYAPITCPYFLSPSTRTSTTPRTLLPSPSWIWLRRAPRTQGRLFGGCLTVVARIQGIAHISPSWKDKIMFLESATAEADMTKGNPLARIRSAFADLAARGVFDEIAGLVVGRAYGYNTEQERAEYAAVIQGLLCKGRLGASTSFPILMNVDIGHTAPIVTLPMDALAVLDSEKDEFSIAEAMVV
ncbi:LD-carboxypeptidase [Colletotrichum costaricense]|uniref:LD-carboxypeptidase n=1 Tax=Colletotrichum costaricense TaxID=1209916 RepID=A0AAJ0DRP8_9PEZI|nr:LD-carboxypeptidase [Colletotrichum costaricense]KAK1505158.1 LD-carboxypeptidase [Colletotrichum costaricense]